MRPHGSAKQLEARRRKAVALSRRGYSRSAIARRLNATPQAVGQWLRAYQDGGSAALAAKPVPGRPSKLTRRQQRSLVHWVLKGAKVCGFATDLWTCPRLAQMIRQRYGVAYHVDHVGRLMASFGFSPSEARVSSVGA